MSRLEEILFDRTGMLVENHCDIEEAMKLYAEECVKASLEKASRVAKTFKNSNSGSYLDASIDKSSINQESNIVLL